MNELEKMGAFSSLEDREAFVDHLNEVHGVAIRRARAGNAFVALQIGKVDRDDIGRLLSIIDAELEKRFQK